MILQTDFAECLYKVSIYSEVLRATASCVPWCTLSIVKLHTVSKLCIVALPPSRVSLYFYDVLRVPFLSLSFPKFVHNFIFVLDKMSRLRLVLKCFQYHIIIRRCTKMRCRGWTRTQTPTENLLTLVPCLSLFCSIQFLVLLCLSWNLCTWRLIFFWRWCPHTAKNMDSFFKMLSSIIVDCKNDQGIITACQSNSAQDLFASLSSSFYVKARMRYQFVFCPTALRFFVKVCRLVSFRSV